VHTVDRSALATAVEQVEVGLDIGLRCAGVDPVGL
jgi:hypothetical protein